MIISLRLRLLCVILIGFYDHSLAYNTDRDHYSKIWKHQRISRLSLPIRHDHLSTQVKDYLKNGKFLPLKRNHFLTNSRRGLWRYGKSISHMGALHLLSVKKDRLLISARKTHPSNFIAFKRKIDYRKVNSIKVRRLENDVRHKYISPRKFIYNKNAVPSKQAKNVYALPLARSIKQNYRNGILEESSRGLKIRSNSKSIRKHYPAPIKRVHNNPKFWKNTNHVILLPGTQNKFFINHHQFLSKKGKSLDQIVVPKQNLVHLSVTKKLQSIGSLRDRLRHDSKMPLWRRHQLRNLQKNIHQNTPLSGKKREQIFFVRKKPKQTNLDKFFSSKPIIKAWQNFMAKSDKFLRNNTYNEENVINGQIDTSVYEGRKLADSSDKENRLSAIKAKLDSHASDKLWKTFLTRWKQNLKTRKKHVKGILNKSTLDQSRNSIIQSYKKDNDSNNTLQQVLNLNKYKAQNLNLGLSSSPGRGKDKELLNRYNKQILSLKNLSNTILRKQKGLKRNRFTTALLKKLHNIALKREFLTFWKKALKSHTQNVILGTKNLPIKELHALHPEEKTLHLLIKSPRGKENALHNLATDGNNKNGGHNEERYWDKESIEKRIEDKYDKLLKTNLPSFDLAKIKEKKRKNISTDGQNIVPEISTHNSRHYVLHSEKLKAVLPILPNEIHHEPKTLNQALENKVHKNATSNLPENYSYLFLPHAKVNKKTTNHITSFPNHHPAVPSNRGLTFFNQSINGTNDVKTKSNNSTKSQRPTIPSKHLSLFDDEAESNDTKTYTIPLKHFLNRHKPAISSKYASLFDDVLNIDDEKHANTINEYIAVPKYLQMLQNNIKERKTKFNLADTKNLAGNTRVISRTPGNQYQDLYDNITDITSKLVNESEYDTQILNESDLNSPKPDNDNRSDNDSFLELDADESNFSYNDSTEEKDMNLRAMQDALSRNDSEQVSPVENGNEGSRFNHEIIVYSDNDNSTTVADITSELARDDIVSIKDDLTNKSLMHFSPSINMKTNHYNVENNTISPTIANLSILSDTKENNFALVKKEELKKSGNSSKNNKNLVDGLNATRLLNDTLEKNITKNNKSLSSNNNNKDLMEESIDAMDFLSNLTVNETHEFIDMNNNVSQTSDQNKKSVNDSSYTFQNKSNANTNNSTKVGQIDLGLFDITNMNMPDNMTVNDAYVIENAITDNNSSISKIGAQNTTRIESNKTIENGNNSVSNKTNILDTTQMNTKAGKNDTIKEIKTQNATKNTPNKTSKMCHLNTNMNLLRGSDCDVSGDMAIGSVLNTVKNESLGSHFGDDNEMTSAGNRKKKKINDFNSVIEENVLGHKPLDNSAAKTANNSFTLIETLNSPFPLVENLATAPAQTSGVQMAKLDNMSVPLLSNNTGYNSDWSITTEYNFSIPILSNISFSPVHTADEPTAKVKNLSAPLLSHASKTSSLTEGLNNSLNSAMENSTSLQSTIQISNKSVSSNESKETESSSMKNDIKQNAIEADNQPKIAQKTAATSNHDRTLSDSTAYTGNGSEKINETTQSAPNVVEDVTDENINNKFKEVFINTTNLSEDDLKMLSEYGYNVLENDIDSKIKNKTLDSNTDVLANLNGVVAPNEKQDINLERNDSDSDTTDYSNLGNFTSADNDLLTDLTGKDALKESEKSSAEDEEILKNVDQNIARDTDAEMSLKGIENENFIDLKTNTLGKDLLMLGNDSLGSAISTYDIPKVDGNKNADRKVKENEIYNRMTNNTGASTGKTITEGNEQANQENKTDLSENISKDRKPDTNDSIQENKVVAITESKPDSDQNIKKPISDKNDNNENLIPSNGTNAPKNSQNEFYDALENELNKRLNRTIEGLNNLNKTRSDDFSGLLIQNIVERNLSGSNKNLSIDDQFVTPIRLKAVKEEEKLVKFANQIAKRENMSNENDINNDVNSTSFKSNDTILGGNNSDKINVTHKEDFVNNTEKINEKETDNVTKEQRSLTNIAHNKTDGKDIYINFNYFINKDKENQKEFTSPLHDIFQIEPLMNGKEINEKFLTKSSYSDIGNADQLENNPKYLKKHLNNNTMTINDPEKYKVHLYSEDGHEDKSANFIDENDNNLYRYTVDNNNEDDVKKYSFNLNDLRESIAKIKHSAPLPNVGIPETQILKPSQQHALLEQRDFNLEPDDIEKDVPPSEEPHLHRILSYKGHSENTALLPVDYSVSNENGFWDGHVGENRPGEIKPDEDDIHEEGDTDSMEDITSLDEK